jgi:1-acyl-sn-glycerol-3-phosphate acyltransferase
MPDPKVVPLSGEAGSAADASRRPGADLLAAGAGRASGERAKRRRTPLLADGPAEPASPQLDLSSPDSLAAIRAHRPRTTPTSRRVAADDLGQEASASEALAPKRPGRPSRSAFAPAAASARAAHPASGALSPPTARRTPRAGAGPRKPLTVVRSPAASVPTPGGSGLEELVTLAVATLRRAAQASGFGGDDIERQVAATLAFLRRRLTGNYTVDEFGFDEDFTENVYLPVLRPLYKSWFRVEVRGIENIPSSGGALVVANHSGTVALDALMAQVAVHDEHPAHRHLRMLGADLVFQTPVIGKVARKSGSTLAANLDAQRLLASGELAGVWPEGFKGVGKPFSERYKLQRFGRGGFVAAALRTGAPIVPCSIVGAEEIYPMLGNLRTIARLVGAPYIPITPTFPLLGLFGLVPLPSKWIIEFGAPVDTATLGPSAADDPMIVFDLTDQVRETIQQTLYALLMQRRSVFF